MFDATVRYMDLNLDGTPSDMGHDDSGRNTVVGIALLYEDLDDTFDLRYNGELSIPMDSPFFRPFLTKFLAELRPKV